MEKCLCGKKIWNKKFWWNGRMWEDKYSIICEACFEEATRENDKHT